MKTLNLILILNLIFIAIIIFGFNIVTKNVATVPEQVPTVIVNDTEVPFTPLGKFDITFYNLSKNRTATGFEVQEGHTVACDFKIIPKKSYIYIEGFGVRQCVDTGKDIKNKRLDIYMKKTTKELFELGYKKDIDVYLIGD